MAKTNGKRHTREEIDAILYRCRSETVSDVAHCYGIKASLIYHWRSNARKKTNPPTESEMLNQVDELKLKLIERHREIEALKARLIQYDAMSAELHLVSKLKEEIVFLKRAIHYFAQGK